MGIKQFQLFHGAVLAKLVRSDHPIALRMIETKEDAWSVYTINDEVELFVKHSISVRQLSREKDGLSWSFHFTAEQIEQLQVLQASKQVAIALVCGQSYVRDEMQIAFVEPKDVKKILDLSTTEPQSLTVKCIPNKQLRVIVNRKVILFVAQQALDEWKVPGS